MRLCVCLFARSLACVVCVCVRATQEAEFVHVEKHQLLNTLMHCSALVALELPCSALAALAMKCSALVALGMQCSALVALDMQCDARVAL